MAMANDLPSLPRWPKQYKTIPVMTRWLGEYGARAKELGKARLVAWQGSAGFLFVSDRLPEPWPNPFWWTEGRKVCWTWNDENEAV